MAVLGNQGIYVLEIEQSTLDGSTFQAFNEPSLGQIWRWSGKAVRLDGPPSTLLLGNALGSKRLHRRVARIVRRKFDLTETHTETRLENDWSDEENVVEEPGFSVTDGQSEWSVVQVQSSRTPLILLTFPDGLPPSDQDLRVCRVPRQDRLVGHGAETSSDVICFTKGTRIRCEGEDRPVEKLAPGDLVQTKDNGLQEILWIGQRRMSGARLYAMPELRPVRLRADALDSDIPDTDLLVSPQHRILIEGSMAQALFNQAEVLVAASDLVNDRDVFVDHSVREVCYFHLLFAEHSILWANGVQTESYHPANTTLKTVEADQKLELLSIFPDIKRDPYSYGPFARRNLDQSEAAILQHGLN